MKSGDKKRCGCNKYWQGSLGLRAAVPCPHPIPSPSHFARLLLAAASPAPSRVQLGKFGRLYFAQPGAAHFRFARNVLQLNTE